MFTVLFTGLPTDVRTNDVSELLTADPLRLAPASFRIQAYYAASGAFTGTMLLELTTERDAEAVRQQFTGQTIDGSFRLDVHHVLPSHQALSSIAHRLSGAQAAAPAVPAFPAPAPAAAPPRSRAPAKQPAPAAAGGAARGRPGGAAGAGGAQPEGLKLLARLKGRPAEQDKQKTLLERQRAALKKAPGDMLLSRLAGPKAAAAGASAATKKARQATATAAAKVARAKRADGGMDVDRPAGKQAKAKAKPAPPQAQAQPKAKPKTQADLDEEMRAYERARRFQ